MTARWQKIVDRIAVALEPREREWVLGDIAELNLPGPQAAGSLLGLVARRQLNPWTHWKPWLILFGLIVPAGFLFSGLATGLASLQSVYLWMYSSNWTAAYLQPGWLGSELLPQVAMVFISWLVLMGWSWTAGFIFAWMLRPNLWLHAVLLAIVVFLPPLLFTQPGHASLRGNNQGNAVVFANAFYRIAFPLLLKLFLVLLPALLGTRQAAGWHGLSHVARTTIGMSTGLACMSLFSDNQIAWQLRSFFAIGLPRLPWLSLLALATPVTYWFVARLRRLQKSANRPDYFPCSFK